ncbi:MAG TPA: hypothetical protein VGP27_15560 [Mycobacterium sp.]|nr:hypothetical protein [Mycobacterium sp.]
MSRCGRHFITKLLDVPGDAVSDLYTKARRNDGRNTLVTQAKSGPAVWPHDTYSSTVDLAYPFIWDLTSGGPTDGA